ncbi:MAG: hypothetical protein AMXMBFR7_25570 [Planctomycetota bacterium]
MQGVGEADGARIVAFADAIELRILKNIQVRLDEGKSVGHGDLVTVRKIREKYTPPEAPDSTGALVARPGFDPRALRWASLAEVAGELGITERWLRYWVAGQKRCTPALPARKIAGAWQVQPAVAFEHIRKHAAKGSEKMRPPVGWAEDAVAGIEPTNPFGDEALPKDPHELLSRILRDKELLVALSEAKIRAIVAGANALGVQREREARLAGAIRADKVLEMLRALVIVFANLIDERATARAQAVVKQIRAEFNVDLARTNPAAVGLLADFLRGQAQEDIHALHEELKSQCQGLRLTDFDGSPPPAEAGVSPVEAPDLAQTSAPGGDCSP